MDESGTVTLNGLTPIMRPLPDGNGCRFSKDIDLSTGTQHLEIAATDVTGATTTKRYTVIVGGVESTLEQDLNGNVAKEIVAGGSTRLYERDAINRLTAIQSLQTPTTESWRSEFTYDGQSRRVRIVEKTWNTGTSFWRNLNIYCN